MFPASVVRQAKLAYPGECTEFLKSHIRTRRDEGKIEWTLKHHTSVAYIELSKYDTSGTLALIDSVEDDQSALLCVGTKVRLIDLDTATVACEIGEFNNYVNCCRFRDDGRLLIACDSDGKVKVFESNSRRLLRSYDSHSMAVRRCDFMRDRTMAVSAGDDGCAYLYDLSSDTPVGSMERIHTDEVTVCMAYQDAEFLTGSRDGLIKLWDARSGNCSKSIRVPTAVEDCAIDDRTVYVANGNDINVYDMRKEDASLAVKRCHLATVTTVRINGDQLVSGSKDQTVKVSRREQPGEIIRSFLLDKPVTAVASSRCRAVVGTLEGLVKCWNWDQATISAKKEEKGTTDTDGYRHAPLPKGAILLDLPKSEKQRNLPPTLDRLVRSYQYRQALLEAVRLDSVEAFAALCEELGNRGALKTAVRGQDADDLTNVLTFIRKHLQKGGQNETLHGILMLTAKFIIDENGSWMRSQREEYLIKALADLSTTLTDSAEMTKRLEDIIAS